MVKTYKERTLKWIEREVKENGLLDIRFTWLWEFDPTIQKPDNEEELYRQIWHALTAPKHPCPDFF
jgi:hypothetical protein